MSLRGRRPSPQQLCARFVRAASVCDPLRKTRIRPRKPAAFGGEPGQLGPREEEMQPCLISMSGQLEAEVLGNPAEDHLVRAIDVLA